ncbi:unnamed protein product [Rhizopus stolonifer]
MGAICTSKYRNILYLSIYEAIKIYAIKRSRNFFILLQKETFKMTKHEALFQKFKHKSCLFFLFTFYHIFFRNMPRPRSDRTIFTFATPVVVNPGRRSGLVQQEQQQQQQPETLFERVPSETPFSTEGLDEDGELDELDPESINAPRVAWREPIIWAFLQIMLGIHDELAEATDNLYKERIWANAKGLFVEELTEYVERSTEFCANVSVYKMQRKWDSMKRVVFVLIYVDRKS